MTINWAHAWSTVLAAFFASLVEFVEALTVVLAVGMARGWRGALFGAGAALAALLTIVLVLGPALTWIPLQDAQLVVGTLLLLFGMRWLRKAILRSAGVIALRDEEATFVKETELMRHAGIGDRAFDYIAIVASFKITMLEGLEVVFIVIAVGSGGLDLLIPATVGAGAALLLVICLGVAIHRPLTMVPENTLKLTVGVLLSAFGTFWVSEGIGLKWPGGDWALPCIIFAFFAAAFIASPLCRSCMSSRATAQ